MGNYRDMWLFLEQKEAKFLPVSLEMLGEARRLMDKYNTDYTENEKVVAVVLGYNASHLCEQAVSYGADVVYCCDHPELQWFRIEPYTRITARMATGKDDYKSYDKPRYFLFPATHNGRDLSATVLAELDAGLASDCNQLHIEDATFSHKIKTGGVEKKFERLLHMKRPDFSGYEWSTILCLDDPEIEYSPQACSVIPGSFEPLKPDGKKDGKIIKVDFSLSQQDLRSKIRRRIKVQKEVDLSSRDVVVSVGRGIGKDPDKGIRLALELADTVNGELGLSRGVVTAKYKTDPSVAKYLTEARQIGETGQTVKAKLYLALGISGAIQHKKGMDKCGTIIAVNTDETAPIKEFCDYFIKGDLYEVVPKFTDLLKSIKDASGSSSNG